jgi:hypothetical protein
MEGTEWGIGRQKDLRTGHARPCLLHIGEQGFADLLWEWKTHRTLTLARDAQGALVPVNVLPLQGSDVPRPESEAGQQEEDRPITHPTCGGAITGGQHTFHGLCGQILGQGG